MPDPHPDTPRPKPGKVPNSSQFLYRSKRRLPRILAYLASLARNVDKLELLSQISLAWFMQPEDTFPDPDKAGQSQVILEFLTWHLLSQPPKHILKQDSCSHV